VLFAGRDAPRRKIGSNVNVSLSRYSLTAYSRAVCWLDSLARLHVRGVCPRLHAVHAETRSAVMVDPVRLIRAKRYGETLTDVDLHGLIRGYVDGDVPEYQMAAFAMAVYFQGMTAEETAALTRVMLDSGTRLSWTGGAPKVDKHSTGGIGDKVSLVLAPMLACLGLQVPMISGRALGITGGTLDKLESIPGYRTDLSLDEMTRQTETVGCVITGASDEIAPADRKLYALRDVTATVPSIPLITASILSKKLAASLDALVLDVKFGSGAFMKTRERARALAHSLVRVGHAHGVATTACLTDMSQPLGRMAGNAVEVQESLDTLRGGGPDDLTELTCALVVDLLVATGRVEAREDGLRQARETLTSGAALDKFHEMVRAQGGDPDAPLEVVTAEEVCAARGGYVHAVDAERLGQAVIDLGGGRKVAGATIDHAVGVEAMVRIGDRVESGQPVARVFGHDGERADAARDIAAAFTIEEAPCDAPPLIAERIDKEAPDG